MAFHKFPELPKELRLQIIEEAIIPFTRKDNHDNSQARLCGHASIDLEWNQISEHRLFKTIRFFAKDISAFRKICGKRHALLNRVGLILNLHDAVLLPPSRENQFVVRILAQLFDIMKDWRNDAGRGLRGLIDLRLYFIIPPWSTFSSVSCDFGTFPEVQIIGGVSEDTDTGNHFRLHHTALSALHTKLPNLHEVRLPLQLEPSLQRTTEVASDAIETLHAAKPNLTKLDIVVDGYAASRSLGRSNWITVTASLAPLISQWRDNLVCLTLVHPVDVPPFLLNAGNVTWPKLKEMKLSGLLDEPHIGSNQAQTIVNQGCADLLTGLVAALPSMPELTTIRVCLRPAKPHRWGFTLSMDFGTWLRSWDDIPKPDSPTYLPNEGPLKPCSNSLLPVSASAVAIVEANMFHEQPIDVPGSVVTELQDTVRRYRQLELAVFQCGLDHKYGARRWMDDFPCTQWNPQTRSWDPVFSNDMDVLIYEMGKYWESMVSELDGHA